MPDIPKPQLATWLDRVIPTRGAIHAVYRSDVGFGEQHMGWDAASGDWYWCGHGMDIAGKDQRGTNYGGPPQYGSLKDKGPPGPDDDAVMVTHIPIRLLKQIQSRFETVSKVTREDDGSITIDCAVLGAQFEPVWKPDGSTPKMGILRVHALESGQVTWKEQLVEGEKPLKFTFEYQDKLPAGFWLSTDPYNTGEKLPARTLLASYTFDASGDRSKFDRAVVESEAVQTHLDVARALNSATTIGTKPDSGKSESSGGSSSSSPASGAPSAASWLQTPLLITGIVLVAVGAFVLWKRRA